MSAGSEFQVDEAADIGLKANNFSCTNKSAMFHEYPATHNIPHNSFFSHTLKNNLLVVADLPTTKP